MESEDERYPKGRLDAFTDGVLAIVITLLVLELKVPGGEESGRLAEALAEEWRDYVGYLLSFVYVGGVWIVHANVTGLIKRADAVLYRLNLLLLLFVSLTPFVVSLMTTHLGDEGEDLAVALYGINLLVGSLLLNAFIRYSAHHPALVRDGAAGDALREIERRRRGLILMLVPSTLLALFVPNVAVLLYLLVALSFIIAPLIAARRARRAFDAAPSTGAD